MGGGGGGSRRAMAAAGSDGGGAEGGGADGGDGPTPGRSELFSTVVDTFLEKLVAAGSYQRFVSCYRCFYKLQPQLTRSIYDQFISQLQASIKEEIQEVKNEGNLEELLNSLDKIVEEAKGREEPAWKLRCSCSGASEAACCSFGQPSSSAGLGAALQAAQREPGAGRARCAGALAAAAPRPPAPGAAGAAAAQQRAGRGRAGGEEQDCRAAAADPGSPAGLAGSQ
ncbi:polyamine-modulated factor 1 isoform X1 [Passer domesticus]|uniref:polyamine-modulated factor 1 isoform X1 n=1 Tax=Passer domesticus TaxID=48849 RepID=UPI0030FE9FF4